MLQVVCRFHPDPHLPIIMENGNSGRNFVLQVRGGIVHREEGVVDPYCADEQILIAANGSWDAVAIVGGEERQIIGRTAGWGRKDCHT